MHTRRSLLPLLRIFQIVLVCALLGLYGACSFTQKINNGESAYERKQYAEAIPMLQEEYNATRNTRILGRKAFLLGRCYEKINDNASAIPWYEEAVKRDYGLEAIKALAFAYKQDEQYSQALRTFEKWEAAGGQMMEVRREITICRQAIDWKKEGKRSAYSVELMPMNSDRAEYAPTIYNNDFLVFTSDRETATGSSLYKWTGNAFSDLFIVHKRGNEPQSFDRDINTEHNEGAACFSSDFSEMFFTRCYSYEGKDVYCKILLSFRSGGRWSEPLLPFYMEDNVNYGHPTLIENDSVLVFSSNRSDGTGGYDLFYSVRDENGWSAPEAMPSSLNTEGNEMFPTSHGDTLYFSSDHLPGLGGLDIFRSHLNHEGRWSSPKNVGAPVNSGGDDFGFIVDDSGPKAGGILQSGYFSSAREAGRNDDLYRFEKRMIEDFPPDEVIAEEEEPNVRIFLNGKVVEKIYAEAENPNSAVIGKRAIEDARVGISAGSTDDRLRTDADGRFILELTPDIDYVFRASKKDYLNSEARFSTKDLNIDPTKGDQTYQVEIVLDRIYRDLEIVLENIYYDFDKWDIRTDAEPTLDELATLLRNNPKIRIQLSSHTDCRGEDDYNADLSQKRAQSAVDYIINTGIPSGQLVPRGYGEERLEVACPCESCSEADHQRNRRTTFKIID